MGPYPKCKKAHDQCCAMVHFLLVGIQNVPIGYTQKAGRTGRRQSYQLKHKFPLKKETPAQVQMLPWPIIAHQQMRGSSTSNFELRISATTTCAIALFFLSGGGLPDVARVPLGHCPMCNPECPLHPSNTLFDWLWLALI